MTRNERLYSLLTDIDERWIAEAAPRVARRTSRGRWIRWVTVAACLVLLVGVMLAWGNEHLVTPPIDPDAPDQPTSPDVPIEPDDPHCGGEIPPELHATLDEIIDHTPWNELFPRNGLDAYELSTPAQCFHNFMIDEEHRDQYVRGWLSSVWVSDRDDEADQNYNQIFIDIIDISKDSLSSQEYVTDLYLNHPDYTVAENFSYQFVEDHTVQHINGTMWLSQYYETEITVKILFDKFKLHFHYRGEQTDGRDFYNMIMSCPFWENVER